MKLSQQGDVLLKTCKSIPTTAKQVKPNRFGYVLAYGEVTGHKHAFSDVENVEMFEDNGKTYVRIKKSSTLNHEEHKPITVEPGIYEIGIVKEYDHFLEESRKVID